MSHVETYEISNLGRIGKASAVELDQWKRWSLRIGETSLGCTTWAWYGDMSNRIMCSSMYIIGFGGGYASSWNRGTDEHRGGRYRVVEIDREVSYTFDFDLGTGRGDDRVMVRPPSSQDCDSNTALHALCEVGIASILANCKCCC